MQEKFAFVTRFRDRYILDIRTSSDLSQGQSVLIYTGLTKSMCRSMAKSVGATCWNF